jgi:hypothetical protein
VRTTGRQQWSVVTKKLAEALRVRESFGGRGLSCGPIKQYRDGYGFLADAVIVRANGGPQPPQSAVS